MLVARPNPEQGACNLVCKTNITAMILTLALALGWGGSAIAQMAAPPNAMPAVRSLGDRILALAKDPSCRANQEGCREKLRALIEQYWDTTDMARSALGYHWKTLDIQQQQQFTKLFSDLVESIYLSRSNFSRAEGYTDTVRIDYLKEIPKAKITAKSPLPLPSSRVKNRSGWITGRTGRTGNGWFTTLSSKISA